MFRVDCTAPNRPLSGCARTRRAAEYVLCDLGRTRDPSQGCRTIFRRKRGTKLLRAGQTHLYELIETQRPRVARPLHILSERETEKCQRAEEQPTELDSIHMEASETGLGRGAQQRGRASENALDQMSYRAKSVVGRPAHPHGRTT